MPTVSLFITRLGSIAVFLSQWKSSRLFDGEASTLGSHCMRSDSKSWRSKLPRKLSNGLAAMAALFMMCGYAEALAASDRVPAPTDPAAQIFGPSSAFQAPQDLTFRVVTILSDGVRLHGE